MAGSLLASLPVFAVLPRRFTEGIDHTVLTVDDASPRSRHDPPLPTAPGRKQESVMVRSPHKTALVLAVLAALFSTSAAYGAHVYTKADSAAAGEVTYTPSTANFANPERGLYHHTGDCDKNDFSPDTLADYRDNQGISQVMCVFYLAEFKSGPIDQAALTQLREQLATVRDAGLKMVLRFAYTTSTDGDDAPKDRVLAHLDQLAPILRDSSDVIAVMQGGFIGAWGEWYYTQNFGNAGSVSEADWANRKAVVDKLLTVLPKDRMVQLRTPKFKRTLYSPDPLPPTQAYDGSARARLGHHNDCFLASPDDFGTYEDPAVEYPYLKDETKYLAMGGETCGQNPPRSSCPTALEELSGFHWSYLNADYHPGVLADWKSGGCWDELTRRLGYRFTLQKGSYPDTAAPGGSLPVKVSVKNDGWASPFNPRDVELVLRNDATGKLHRLALDNDPRTWQPGTTTTLDEKVTLPADLAQGTYSLLLNLPDPRLPDRAAYAIRLANEDTWEKSSGMNDLLHKVTVN